MVWTVLLCIRGRSDISFTTLRKAPSVFIPIFEIITLYLRKRCTNRTRICCNFQHNISDAMRNQCYRARPYSLFSLAPDKRLSKMLSSSSCILLLTFTQQFLQISFFLPCWRFSSYHTIKPIVFVCRQFSSASVTVAASIGGFQQLLWQDITC